MEARSESSWLTAQEHPEASPVQRAPELVLYITEPFVLSYKWLLSKQGSFGKEHSSECPTFILKYFCLEDDPAKLEGQQDLLLCKGSDSIKRDEMTF